MRITIQPERQLGIEAITIDPNYNESIENVICLISLKITALPANEIRLFYDGRHLQNQMTLDKLGVQEGHIISLSRRETGCCELL